MRGAIVAAGGPGRRMGRAKALIRVAGEPLVLRVVRIAQRLADEVVVVAKKSHAPRIGAVIPEGVTLLTDSQRVQSPLVAFSTGAAAVSSEYVAFLACDLPFLAPAVLGLLFRAAEGHDAAIPRWADGRIEPMAAVYCRAAAREAAAQALDRGDRANTDMIARLPDVAYVPTEDLRVADPDLESFLNVNTPKDLARARARLGGP